MNTSSGAMHDSFDSPVIAERTPARTCSLFWSIKRELWEYPSIYVAPLVVSGLMVFAFLVSSLAGIWQQVLRLDPTLPLEKLMQPFTFAALVLMGTAFVVAAFYSLDALHGERRDRSILFWKSLPVSDFTTVFSKACIPLLVLPLITFVMTVATQWLMLLVGSAVLMVDGRNAAALWTQIPWFSMTVMLFYHLIAVHALWYAPFFGFMLFVSSWARRTPFLSAVIPVTAVAVVEKHAFHTSHIANMLAERFSGGSEAGHFANGNVLMPPLSQLTPGRFLINPGLWIGLAIWAAFLLAAVRLRRSQGPI